MDEPEDTLINAHRAAMARYAYFLLAVAVVAIAYALSATRYSDLAPSEIPLGLAVLCWFASFYYGCQHVESHFNSLRFTALLRQARDGGAPADPETKLPTPEAAEKALRRANSRMLQTGRLQFRLLILGGLFYLGWHLMEMFLRTSTVVV